MKSDGIEKFEIKTDEIITSIRADYYPQIGQYVVRSVYHSTAASRRQINRHLRCLLNEMSPPDYPPVIWPDDATNAGFLVGVWPACVVTRVPTFN